jgi:uncharacterized SAM-binding protein YcdF (DUF218 family)
MRIRSTGDTAIKAGHGEALGSTKNLSARATRFRYLATVLVLIAVCVGMWIEREALLRGAADLWIVSDQITPADAVVVLGGGIDVRPFEAADLYAKGMVRKVLLSEVEEGPSVDVGAVTGHAEGNRQVLLRLGVPESAIEKFGKANKNTREEAISLKDWTVRNEVSVLIIPTEIFAARRVRWIFRREFAGTGVLVEVPSFEPPRQYKRTEWWKTENGMLAFQNEVLKYFYYRLKY